MATATTTETTQLSPLREKFEQVSQRIDNWEQGQTDQRERDSYYRRLHYALISAAQNGPQNGRQIDPNDIKKQMAVTGQQTLHWQNVLPGLTEEILTEFRTYLRMCEEAANAAYSTLQHWKHLQKHSQYGLVPKPDLHSITHAYKETMNAICDGLQLMNRMNDKIIDNGQMIELSAKLRTLLLETLRNSLVITTQPPMVYKNQIGIQACILAAIDRLGLELSQPSAVACILNEEVVTRIYGTVLDIPEKDTKGKINDLVFRRLVLKPVNNGMLGFEEKSVKISVPTRKMANKCPDAIMKKYYICITATVNVLQEAIRIRTLSLPFMLSVHNTQDVKILAKAVWDMAFSDNLEQPLTIRQSVRWSELAPVLKSVFLHTTNTKRKLNENDVHYWKLRLFNGYEPEADPEVDWNRLVIRKLCKYNDQSVELDFTFWQWFFYCMDVIQNKSGRETAVKDMWENNYIAGFVQRQDAERFLAQFEHSALLLRFCDNHLACIGPACKLPGTKAVVSLKPFTFKEIERLSLPASVVTCAPDGYTPDDVPYVCCEDRENGRWMLVDKTSLKQLIPVSLRNVPFPDYHDRHNFFPSGFAVPDLKYAVHTQATTKKPSRKSCSMDVSESPLYTAPLSNISLIDCSPSSSQSPTQLLTEEQYTMLEQEMAEYFSSRQIAEEDFFDVDVYGLDNTCDDGDLIDY